MASREPERAKAMLYPYPEARACSTYEDLIADESVEAIYIPLVNSLHLEWSVRALEAGKHVLCEKPLAMNAHEAETMAGAAKRSGKLLMEAFMYRMHPDTSSFIKSIAEPIHVQASFGFNLHDLANYRLRAELGGGALLDVGCYAVNVSRWILGEPVDISARLHMNDAVDMTVSALLEFSEGRTASIWASFESPEEQQLRVIAKDIVHSRARPFTSRHDPWDPYQIMVESFGDSILDGRPQPIPIEDSIANMRVLDRIREVATQAG